MVTRKPPLVLLTAYNGAAYLPAQLSSLCAQAVTFTAILRDDGSADDTPALFASNAIRTRASVYHQRVPPGAVGGSCADAGSG
ncbi:MAG: hypothetical protein ACLT1X_13620 [Christensenellales bacterium]